jgi:hypothetical protein
MPMPKIKITTRKNGQQVAWFRDDQKRRVRTSVNVNWVKADQIKLVADYGIALQLGQLDAGLGSDGASMPPLKGGGTVAFLARVNGRATFERRSYAGTKIKLGLKPMRDLLGPGIGGHMRNDIRINSLDDRQATIAITTRQSRIKALANEKRAPWWGWSPASVALLTARAAEVYGSSTADYLVAVGLLGANTISGLSRRTLLRRAA